MKGRPILVEYQDEPVSLSELARVVGISPRAMLYRHKRKRDLFAPASEKHRRRGRWDQVGNIVRSTQACMIP